MMKRLGLPELLDQHLPRHGLHQGLSWGWTAAIWLAHMMTESDHRKVHVQAWAWQAHATIQRLTGQTVTEWDFADDRLSKVLRRLSQPATWQAIETALGRSILRVYELTPERVRLDATTVSGYHVGGERVGGGFGRRVVATVWGFGDPLKWLSFLLVAIALDVMYNLFTRWQHAVVFLAIIGGLAHAVKPLSRALISSVSGLQYTSLLSGVIYPTATHILFGFIGAFVGAGMVWGYRRLSKR